MGVFAYLRYILIGGWALVGLGLLYVLFSRSPRDPLRLVTLAGVTIVIFVGLVPQPYLRDSLKTLLFGTQDLVFAGKDFVEQLAPLAPADLRRRAITFNVTTPSTPARRVSKTS